MAEYACPSCGAPIPFRSSFSVYAVCASCGSTVVRGDRDVSLIGKMADLPDEITPLQLGAQLRHAGQTYALLGRLRMAWADGAWNEWFVDGGDRRGWLAEAQGFFALCFEEALPPSLAGAPPALGSTVTIGGRNFRVSDIKQATCVGSEGELPFPAPRGRVATYYDMIEPTGCFAGLEIADDEKRLYVGVYLRTSSLVFSGLRPVEGWTEPNASMMGDPALVSA